MNIPPDFKPVTNKQLFEWMNHHDGFRIFFSATGDEQVMLDVKSLQILAICRPATGENWVSPSFVL
jgi:hypothetical protein